MLAALALLLALDAPVPLKPPAKPVLKNGTSVMLWNGNRYAMTLDFASGSYAAVSDSGSVWVGYFAWCEKERLWQVDEVHQGSDLRLKWYIVLDDSLSGRAQGGSSAAISVSYPKSVDTAVPKRPGRKLPLPRPFPR